MIELKSTEQRSRAIARARKSDLLVCFVAWREYVVINRATGEFYNVNFIRAGRRFGHCNCPAGEPVADYAPILCKHLAAASAVQIGVASMRR